MVAAADPAVYSSPEKLAAALYAPYQDGGQAVLPELLSPEALEAPPTGFVGGGLAEMLPLLFEQQEQDPSLSLGYDPLVDGQDFEITDFQLAPPELGETGSGKKMALVIATFKNFGDPREIWLGMELSADGNHWLLNAVQGKRGAEGRSYHLLQDLEMLGSEPSPDQTTPFATSASIDWVLELAAQQDSTLVEKMEKEMEPLGEARAAMLGGVFGDSPLGRSAVLPAAALFVKKADQADAGDIYRLWIEGDTELLDEQQNPLVITDPPPTSATVKPVVQSASLLMIGGIPEDVKQLTTVAKLASVSSAETLGHFLLEESDWERTQNDLAEIDFGDERNATLSWSGNGHMTTRVDLVYSEGDHGAWRFTLKSWTAGPPNVLLVEILDDEGKVQVQEEGEATAWVLFFDGVGRLQGGRSNAKAADQPSPRLWPKQSFPARKPEDVLSLLGNLPLTPTENRVEVIEQALDAWLGCMGVSLSGEQ
jgi:hypothetical protein